MRLYSTWKKTYDKSQLLFPVRKGQVQVFDLIPNTVEPAYFYSRFTFSTRIKYENQPVLKHLYIKQARIMNPTLNPFKPAGI